MTLQESEEKLSELNAQTDKLLEKREVILKEWNTAFCTENPEGIVCIDEGAGDNYILYF